MSSESAISDLSRGASKLVLDSGRSHAASANPRTAADLSSLLLELARLVRGIGFYSSRDAMRGELLDRAHLAWQADLARNGAIDLAIETDGFHAHSVGDRIDAPHLKALALSMRQHGIEHMRVEPDVAREAFEGLGLLLSDPVGAQGAGDAVKPLAAIGLVLTRSKAPESAVSPTARRASSSAAFAPAREQEAPTEDPSETQPIVEVPRLEPPKPRPYGVPAASETHAPEPDLDAATRGARDRRTLRDAMHTRPDVHSAPVPLRDGPLEESEILDETSPLDAHRAADSGPELVALRRDEMRARASAEDAAIAPTRTLAGASTAPATVPVPIGPPASWLREPEEAATDEAAAGADPDDISESTASIEVGPDAPPRVESLVPRVPVERREAPRDETAKPTLEQDPTVFPGDPRGEALREHLRALDGSRDLDRYRQHCVRVLEATSSLMGHDLRIEGYRAALVLRRHSAGGPGQTADIADHARAALTGLCSPDLLHFVIERACSQDAAVGLHAAQILLAVGTAALPAILSFLRRGAAPDRVAQLSAVVIAMGERAVEPLRKALENAGGAPQRVIIQLAGELRSEELVPSLAPLLHDDDAGLRKDASKALLLIGGASHDAFIEALSSNAPDLSRNAAHCLGKLGHKRAVRPLLSSLERSLRRRDEPLAREILRALGEIGEPRAVAPLAEVVGRSSWLEPRGRAETRLAAVAAIERIPGGDAEAVLRGLAGGRNRALSARARQALARRNGSDGGAGSATQA